MSGVIVIIIFVAIVGLFIGAYVHRRQEVFEGEVIDKDIQEQVNNNFNGNQNRSGVGFTLRGVNFNNNNGSNVTHTYSIKVRITTGKEINWQISEGKYEIVKIGDHVTKQAGTTEVDITPKAQPGLPTTTPRASTSQPSVPTPPTAPPPASVN